MSSVVSPTRPPAPKTEEVRSSLHSHLRKTAQFIKILDALVILFAWIAAVLAIWLVACVIDHWIFPLPVFARWMIWCLAVSGTLWWTVAHLIPLLFQRINPVYAARRIEGLVPEFKNGLVSWLELESMPEHGVPRGVMAALTYRAARFIGGQDPSATVDTSQLIKLIGGALLLTTSLAVYTMVSPKSTFVTGKRIAMPWASVNSPTRVQILEVTPGSIELTQGKPLQIDVQMRGLLTNEPVFVRFSTLDGQLTDQRVSLDASSEGLRYRGSVATGSTGIDHELDYWIEAGDARRGPYRVTLNPLPTVALESTELVFPPYTKLEPRVVPANSNVEAVEGTRATIVATANQPMIRGKLEVDPEVDVVGELIRARAFIEMKAEDRRLSGELLLQLDEEANNPTKLGFRIRGYNATNDTNSQPIVHSMSVFADMAPEISLLGPESRVLRVAPKSRVNLEIRANDPDYGIAKLAIQIRKNNAVVMSETLIEADGLNGRQVRKVQLKLADHSAKIGDEFVVLATVLDNRHDPVTGQPAPNQTSALPLRLQVVGAEQEDAPEEFVEPGQSPEGVAPQNSSPGEPGRESPTQGQPGQPAASNGTSGDGRPNASNGATNPPQGNQGMEPSNTPQDGQPDGNEGQQQNNTSEKNGSGQEQNPSQSNSSQERNQQSGGQQGGEQQQNQSQQSGGGSKGEQTQSGQGQQGSESGGSSASDSSSQSQQGPGNAASGGQSSSTSSDGNAADGSAANDSGATSKAGNRSNNGSGGQSSQSSNSQGATEPNSGQSSTGQNTQGNNPNGQGASSQSQGSNSNANPSEGSSDSAQPMSDTGNAKPQGSQNASGQSAGDRGASQNSDTSNSPSQSDADAMQRVKDFMESKQKASQSGDAANTDGSKPQNSNQGQDSSATGSSSKKPDSAAENSAGKENGSAADPSKALSSEQGSPQEQNNSKQGTDNGSQSGAKQGTGGQSGAKQGSESGSEQSSESGSQQGSQSSSKQGAEAGSESGSKSGSQAGSESGSKSGSPQGSESGSESGSKQGSESGSGQSSESGGQKGSESGAQKGSESGSASGSEQGSESQSGSKQGSESGAQSGSKQGNAQGAGKGSQSGSESGSQSGSAKGSETGSQQGSETQPTGGQEASQPSGKTQGGGEKASGSESGASSSSAQSQSQSSSQSASGSQSSGTANQGGNVSSGGASQAGDGGGTTEGSKANANDANKTTQLVLDYLNRQRDQPDPELLKELNWSQSDFQQFVERWNQARELSTSADPADRLLWQKKLEELGLGSRDRNALRGSGNNDVFRQQQDGGTRIRPPEGLRKQYDAFRKALQDRNSK